MLPIVSICVNLVHSGVFIQLGASTSFSDAAGQSLATGDTGLPKRSRAVATSSKVYITILLRMHSAVHSLRLSKILLQKVESLKQLDRRASFKDEEASSSVQQKATAKRKVTP